MMQALTSNDESEIKECIRMLISSAGYMYESADKDDDAIYSRAWFAWKKFSFDYLILDKGSLLSD